MSGRVTPGSGEITWGPAVLPNGMFVFMGERKPIPCAVKDPLEFIRGLEKVERFLWSISLPEERERIFRGRLSDRVAFLKPNWACYAIDIGAMAGTAFIIGFVLSKTRIRFLNI